ncbi:hypothetical protein, partial [Agromyces humi]|uniref:hypothetical protein n=1 Tax=Agromyces humi TaxID=1766800 RepID=UPI001358D340
MSDAGTSELEARIAKLEAENAALRAGSVTATVERTDAASSPPRERRHRGRTVAAVALVVVALLLAPVAVISAWARLQLVDTDQFVATFAPLAEEPAVQAYVGDQVTAAIEEQVDIPTLTSDLFDGIKQLDLPPRAQQALGLLEAPATQGLQSLVSGIVDRLVESPAFADIWRAALTRSHQAFVAAVQGDPDSALAIGGDGTVSVQLGPIIEAVKDRLEQQGVGFAANIPVVERSIVIAQNDAFVLIQTVYALAVAVGTWLPWVCLALLAAGVLVAKRRTVALVWTAAGLALTMLILAAGLGIGRTFFIGTVSPSIMPSDTASVLFDGLVELMLSTIVAVLVLAVLVAVIGWFSGPWRPARAARGFAESGFASLRASAARHGVTTGSFGVALDRWRGGLYVIVAIVAAAVVLLNRPVTTSLVVWTVIVALLVVLLIELLRRPAAEVAAQAAAAETAAADAEIAAADAATTSAAEAA